MSLLLPQLARLLCAVSRFPVSQSSLFLTCSNCGICGWSTLTSVRLCAAQSTMEGCPTADLQFHSHGMPAGDTPPTAKKKKVRVSIAKEAALVGGLSGKGNMAQDGSVKLQEEAGGAVYAVRSGSATRSKRSLSFDGPGMAPSREDGPQVLMGSKRSVVKTVSKRSRKGLASSPTESPAPGGAPSPLAYFGIGDKEAREPLKEVAGEGKGAVLEPILGSQTLVKEAAMSSSYVVVSLSDPESLCLALEHLKNVDERLRCVIDMHEGPKFQKCGSAFVSLARSIVFQQLATKAASAIYGRVEALCGGESCITPEVLSKLSAAELRAVGISERKASYLHDLAKHFTSGALSHAAILDMDDDALMAALTAVRGIGVWSVHMFMIFSLHRPDILPVGDLGVRKGFQKLFQLKALPAPSDMEELALKWRPYRSLGSWYMWRVLNMDLPFKAQ